MGRRDSSAAKSGSRPLRHDAKKGSCSSKESTRGCLAHTAFAPREVNRGKSCTSGLTPAHGQNALSCAGASASSSCDSCMKLTVSW
eukprot:1171077-Pleurochrysis_carterae.AAC.3